MKKRILPLLLALAMCLGLAAPAFASSDDFMIEDGILIAYHGPGGNVAIPNGVTGIGDWAFYDCTSLTSVAIPNRVTSIGDSAFEGCTSLTGVTIPNSVTEIGDWAFAGCTSLTSVTIPNSVTNIGSYAFSNTPWLKNQGEWPIVNGILLAYQGNGGSVTIPNSVTSIGDFAFLNCTGLTSVTIPNGVTSIGKQAFQYCASLTSVTIPDSVTSIGASAFADCPSLTSVVIPDGVTSIESGTFFKCTSLTSVTIPNSVTSIGQDAFYCCENLTSLTLPDSVTSIGVLAFHYCTGLTTVTIPSSVTSIENYAFWYCSNLTSVFIPSSVTSIGETVFSDCTSLKDVYYGGSEAQWNAIQIAGNNETLTSAAIHYNSPMPAAAVAYASTQIVLVDDRPVEFQAYALKDENGNDTNYVKLRDVAYVLNGSAAQFDVGWDQAAGAISVTAGQPYKTAGGEMSTPYSGNRSYTVSDSPLFINGQSADLTAIRLTDDVGNGYTYFKLRDLGEALGFTVGWSEGTGIFIETK